MAGPDFGRPSIEQQLGLDEVARQQGNGLADKLPVGCEVNGWRQVSINGRWFAEATVRTPDGNYHAQFMFGGTEGQIEPPASQAIGSLVNHEA